MIPGSLVNLRAVEPVDYELLWRWLNDPVVMEYWGRPGNTESLSQVVEREQAESKRATSQKYLIETKEGEAIGQVDYYDLVWEHRSAWTSIMIGNPSYWGGGFGTDAMRTLLTHLFSQLNLHRVTLTVHASNTRAQRSYQKNGFIQEGVLREWQYFGGSWVDGVVMAVLASDFRAINSV